MLGAIDQFSPLQLRVREFYFCTFCSRVLFLVARLPVFCGHYPWVSADHLFNLVLLCEGLLLRSCAPLLWFALTGLVSSRTDLFSKQVLNCCQNTSFGPGVLDSRLSTLVEVSLSVRVRVRYKIWCVKK